MGAYRAAVTTDYVILNFWAAFQDIDIPTCVNYFRAGAPLIAVDLLCLLYCAMSDKD